MIVGRQNISAYLSAFPVWSMPEKYAKNVNQLAQSDYFDFIYVDHSKLANTRVKNLFMFVSLFRDCLFFSRIAIVVSFISSNKLKS